METTRVSGNGRHRRRFLMFFTVILAIASIGTTVYTFALFTSSAVNGSNDFTTGTIDIALSPASAVLAASNMMPGDSANGTLTVQNNGTGTLRYAMTAAATNADGKGLRDQLGLVVKTKDTDTAGCGNFNGAQLYSGTLAAAFFGDPTTGDQGADRTLAGAASEVLCFRTTLPLSTGNAFQAAATTATFTFSAEQTANNP
jgi:Camelysin metallo-endopeptidase